MDTNNERPKAADITIVVKYLRSVAIQERHKANKAKNKADWAHLSNWKSRHLTEKRRHESNADRFERVGMWIEEILNNG